MKPFLYETAEEIIKNYKDDLPNCCLIFPNKRTKFYFRKYYAQILGKTSRPAKMIEIGKYIRQLTGFEDAEKLSLIFELYKIFKKYSKDYSFDNFYRLGEIILSDFNEIDAWLADPKQIYKNIKDLKEIDTLFEQFTKEQIEILKNFWSNFLNEKDSNEKKIFLKLWNLLPEIYQTFTEELIKQKIAYNGLIYKVLSGYIDENKIDNEKYRHYFFIGFNALNSAELKFFNYFHKKGIAEFYWDVDNYYFSDKKQEAGDFLRKNFKDLNLKIPKMPDNFLKNKKISIIGTSLNINQAKLIHSVLKDKDKDYIENTAIITGDENMLFPVLSALPGNIEDVNVTMGYSFKLTPLYNFIAKYFQLHLFSEKYKKKSFYFKHVLNVLKHPYVNEYDSDTGNLLIKKIEEQKLIFINSEQLTGFENNLLKLIFRNYTDGYVSEQILSDLLNILFIFFDKKNKNAEEKLNTLKNEYIFRAYKKIKRFREILMENNEKLSLKLSSEILLQNLKSDSIPFESETDEGLQIMGLMESRNLDFKNIIILGMNEGLLPKISRSPTFISQNLRFAFNLPLIKHQDSVFAYFFYRLLQRSENISLVYNDLVSDSNSGEQSRFLKQLLFETDFDIKEIHFNDEIFIQNRHSIEIAKNEDVLSILDSYFYDEKNPEAGKAFSASTLNTYLSCSLKFYFRYIAGIKEPEVVKDEFTSAEFGSVLHKALELIYSDLNSIIDGKILKKDDIETMFPKTEEYVLKALKENFKNNKNYTPEGIQIIIKDVLINYVKAVLKYDQKYAPFIIVSLENNKFYNTLLNINYKGQNKQVKLFGIIDRIDEKEGVFRIIDYKSGAKKNEKFSITGLFDVENRNRDSHAFQALFYSLIVNNLQEFSDKKIRPSLYYVRSMNQTDYSDMLITENENDDNIKIKLLLDENVTRKFLYEFHESLINLTEEIFNSEINFCQTKNKKICEYCEFNKICY